MQESLIRKTEEAEHQLAEIQTVYRTAPIGLALFDAKDYRYLRLNDIQASFFVMNQDEVVGWAAHSRCEAVGRPGKSGTVFRLFIPLEVR
jgi:hypothetical protein